MRLVRQGGKKLGEKGESLLQEEERDICCVIGAVVELKVTLKEKEAAK